MPAQSKLPPLAPATSAKVAKKNSFNSNDEAWKANIRYGHHWSIFVDLQPNRAAQQDACHE